jgi:hypothetical protein
MIKNETQRGNIDIAVFIGDLPDKTINLCRNKRCHVNDLNYHLDWNELIRIATHVKSHFLYKESEYRDKLRYALLTLNKESVWRAELSFIKFIEKQKENSYV